MNQDILSKWNSRWIGDVNSSGSITNELMNLAMIREVNSGLREMVNKNEQLQVHSAFYSVSYITYYQTVLMYIRRQVRRGSGSISLIALADDIFKNHSMITKEFYSELYTHNHHEDDKKDFKELGNKDFERLFKGKSTNYLDPEIIKNDIKALEKISNDSSDYIDKRLAHIDKREPSIIPNNDEIESWCNTLNSILRRYILLLQAKDYKIELILEHDWKCIFRHAWL